MFKHRCIPKFRLFNGSPSLVIYESLGVKGVSSISFQLSALCTSRAPQSFGSFVIVSVTQHEMRDRDWCLSSSWSSLKGKVDWCLLCWCFCVHFNPRPFISEINAGSFCYSLWERDKHKYCMFLMCWWSLLWWCHERR